MDDLISVIVPVYNVEDYLEKSLSSLLIQTYRKLQVIIIDDGSTDNSGEICDYYGANDGRIEVYHIQNAGVSNARNQGLNYAKGKYIYFFDPDDSLEPDALWTLYKQIKISLKRLKKNKRTVNKMNNKQFEIGASEQPLDIIKETCGFAGVFKQIGVIGDSLASGEFESHDENGNIVYTDMYEYSWPAVLERITGTKYNNYSRGGMTAREYVQSWADTNGFWQWNQAYIIALGNNDSFVFGHPLGSVKDVNVDCPQDNGDTFFGNMGKIVSKLKTIEPNARIFVVTPQLRGEACDNDIRYIASELAKLCDMFEFTYLLDMTAHAPVYDAEMRKSFGLGFHPNPMGYYAYALIVGNYIDYIIRSNPQEFATIPFVGTLLKNKDYK